MSSPLSQKRNLLQMDGGVSKTSAELVAAQLQNVPRLAKLELLLNLSAAELAAVCRLDRRLALTLCGIGNAQKYRVDDGPLLWGIYAQPDDQYPIEVVDDVELLPELWRQFLERDYGISTAANGCSAYTVWERENVAASLRRYIDGYNVDQLTLLRRLRSLYTQLFNLSLAETVQNLRSGGVRLQSKEVYATLPAVPGSERLTLVDRVLLLFIETCVPDLSDGLVFASTVPIYNGRRIQNTIVFSIVDVVALVRSTEPADLTYILSYVASREKFFEFFQSVQLAIIPGISIRSGNGPGLYEMLVENGVFENFVVYRPPSDPAARTFEAVQNEDELQLQVARYDNGSTRQQIARAVAPYATVVTSTEFDTSEPNVISFARVERVLKNAQIVREVYRLPGRVNPMTKLEWVVPVLKNGDASAPLDRFDAAYIAVLDQTDQPEQISIHVFVLYLKQSSVAPGLALLYEIEVPELFAAVSARIIGPSALIIEFSGKGLAFDWRTGEAFELPADITHNAYFASLPWLRPHTVATAHLSSDQPLFRVKARVLQPTPDD